MECKTSQDKSWQYHPNPVLQDCVWLPPLPTLVTNPYIELYHVFCFFNIQKHPLQCRNHINPVQRVHVGAQCWMDQPHSSHLPPGLSLSLSLSLCVYMYSVLMHNIHSVNPTINTFPYFPQFLEYLGMLIHVDPSWSIQYIWNVDLPISSHIFPQSHGMPWHQGMGPSWSQPTLMTRSPDWACRSS